MIMNQVKTPNTIHKLPMLELIQNFQTEQAGRVPGYSLVACLSRNKKNQSLWLIKRRCTDQETQTNEHHDNPAC